jgi:hypothetical protein
MYRRSMIVVIGMFLLLLAGCEFSASTARIASVELARGFQDNKAVDVTQTFAPTDNPFHAVVTLGNAPDDTTLKAVWTVVDAGEGEYQNQVIDETEIQTGGVADFTLTNEQAWPSGTYKVDIYLNNELDRSVEFEVQ